LTLGSSKLVNQVRLRDTLLTDEKLSKLLEGFNYLKVVKKLELKNNIIGV